MTVTVTASEAVSRALSVVGKTDGCYYLGSGDYRPRPMGVWPGIDLPWTAGPNNKQCSDCAGFAICWCWKLRRHRPGFNKGPWATVEDDINVNSIMEDAVHWLELAYEISPAEVMPGDLLCYPTFKVSGKRFIGHVGIVTDIAPKYTNGKYQYLLVAHCHGPNLRTPAVTLNTGMLWEKHDKLWPKIQHRTHVIRMRGVQ